MPRHSRVQRMMSWWVALVLVPLGTWLFFRWFERANVYRPTRTWWTSGDTTDPSWENVSFETADGVRISAWYFPARPSSEFKEVAVVLSHGNGGNISHRIELQQLLLETGVNVLSYDYRGYGQSRGRPAEGGTYRDGEAAIRWLMARGFAPSNIVAYGESLGGAIAAESALRVPDLRGVVIQSGFTSIADLGRELFPFLPVRTLNRIRYDVREKLSRIKAPVLILHSRDDTLIRFSHAEANFAAASEPKWLREIYGDHNDQPAIQPEIHRQALREFLRATSRR